MGELKRKVSAVSASAIGGTPTFGSMFLCVRQRMCALMMCAILMAVMMCAIRQTDAIRPTDAAECAFFRLMIAATCAELRGELQRKVSAMSAMFLCVRQRMCALMMCAIQKTVTKVLAATAGAFDICAVQREAHAVCANYGIMLMMRICFLAWRIHRQVTPRWWPSPSSDLPQHIIR